MEEIEVYAYELKVGDKVMENGRERRIIEITPPEPNRNVLFIYYKNGIGHAVGSFELFVVKRKQERI